MLSISALAAPPVERLRKRRNITEAVMAKTFASQIHYCLSASAAAVAGEPSCCVGSVGTVLELVVTGRYAIKARLLLLHAGALTLTRTHTRTNGTHIRHAPGHRERERERGGGNQCRKQRASY